MRPARLQNGIVPPTPIAPRIRVVGNGNGSPKPSSTEENGSNWSIAAAEEVLRSLKGVISARVVLKQNGEVAELHLLTSSEVEPKKTVRRVESAFITNWGMRIDHRTVSVAQSRWSVGDKGKKAKSSASFLREPTFLVVDRPNLPSAELGQELRFDGHEVQLEPSGRMRVRVFLDVGGERFAGEATGSQKARSRLTMLASATVDAVLAARGGTDPMTNRHGSSLELEDVDVIDAFKKDYVLASVSMVGAHGVTNSAGAAPVEESLDRAVIMSTLQAAGPWARDQA